MPASVPAFIKHRTVRGPLVQLDMPERGHLHLWSVTIRADKDIEIAKRSPPNASYASALSSLLSPDEQDRSQRYIVPKAQRQFVETRGRLRLLLGSYLQQDPARLDFVYSDNGKPALAQHCGGELLQFNVSHSQERILYAISPNQAVGVDLEGFNPLISHLDIAQRICTPQELGVFDVLPPAAKPAAFFKIWTRKEALVKLFGERLYEKLSVFEVPAHGIAGSFWVQTENRQVWLQDLELWESFAGAIALFNPPQEIVHYEWQTDADEP